MLGLTRGRVQLQPHQASWAKEGERAVRRLRSLFGRRAIAATHVGSTSINGISAKPILDIAVAVRTLDDARAIIPAMRAAGYTHVPENDEEAHDGFGGQVYFSRRSSDGKNVTQHIHVVLSGSREWADYLAFRDYLNARPDIAREYEMLKIRLAKQFPNDRMQYTDGKAEWISGALRRARSWVWLGKNVTVTVDRPIGSPHPQHPDLLYPVNYGYLAGVPGGDGEEQDAYILGISRPVERFTGRVIAVIYRLDDREDKLVVAPSGKAIDQAQILRAVHFQEQYFHIEMEHLYHRSCGMVVYRIRGKRVEYLLLRESRSGVWSIPKGHMEYGENEEETAIRELHEEAGILSRPLPGFRMELTYPIPPIYSKTLVVFLTRCDAEATAQEGEITEVLWTDLSGAKQLLGPRRLMDAINAAHLYISAVPAE